jgi:hypothetical protein
MPDAFAMRAFLCDFLTWLVGVLVALVEDHRLRAYAALVQNHLFLLPKKDTLGPWERSPF